MTLSARTVGDLIVATRRHVSGTHRTEYNRLKTALTPDATSTDITCAYDLGRINSGSRIAIGDEIMFVWDADTASKTFSVMRGDLGSPIQAHAADTVIEVEPRYPQYSIREALRDEIGSWPAGLYATDTADLTIATANMGVDLSTVDEDFIRILEVRAAPPTHKDRWSPVSFDIARNLPVDVYPSGTALYVDKPAQVSGQRIMVTYSKPFDLSNFDTDTTLLDTIGLSDAMADIAPFGAAWRLASTGDVERSETQVQPEPRTADEVPAMFITQLSAGLLKIRDRRINDEIRRLQEKYGVKVLR